MAESFNGWLRDLRGRPVLTMLESIRSKLMGRICTRYEKGCLWNTLITPNICKRLNALVHETGRMALTYAGQDEYETPLEGRGHGRGTSRARGRGSSQPLPQGRRLIRGSGSSSQWDRIRYNSMDAIGSWLRKWNYKDHKEQQWAVEYHTAVGDDSVQFDGCHRVLAQEVELQGTLCTKLETPIDIGIAWRYFRQLMDGLSHIHREGIVHRDIARTNVFLDAKDTIKIGDFGLATSSINATPPLHQTPYTLEQESLYQVLESINSAIDWRTIFPDDLCDSPPHGVVCDFFPDSDGDSTPQITELSFGYVSDFSPNPPCSSNSTFSPSLSSLPYLRKLFFYKCFTVTQVSLPGYLSKLGSSLEEFVFVENPSLVGDVSGILRNFTRLRRVVLSGTGLYGKIPYGIGDLVELEQITMTGNRLYGEVPFSIGTLKKLKVLDLSYNGFSGKIPESLGKLSGLLKLDLSANRFSGKIPENFYGLQSLEFLDLSYNRFANFGVPLFLAELPNLKEVYLSGNKLGGQIPEIWEKMGGILGIGFSGLGLVGNIPSSMGVFLGRLCYLGLDDNHLEGMVPEELGLLESVNEVNLENNMLSGKVPFSAKFASRIGGKLKLGGNSDLCVDIGLVHAVNGSGLRDLKHSRDRKLIAHNRRASMNDFDWFKLMLAKIKERQGVRECGVGGMWEARWCVSLGNGGVLAMDMWRVQRRHKMEMVSSLEKNNGIPLLLCP
ncbi:hypothetical protein L1049_020746 [Liquidambar formosana]|uniref:Protein kinase domain-containing protein n=1 Tax=Liquidambar formosana TaxID=63359 RepID=A0AAP0X699_LIQFO